MQETLRKLVAEALGGSQADFVVEHPADLAMGDYSTNAGIKYRDKKDQVFEYLDKHKPKEVERVEMAGPGFINFYLSKKFFAGSIGGIIKEGEKFGKSKKLKGEKVMVEYTDPNVMKPFHVGHLMSNTIGEAISKIIEWNEAEVLRVNYYSDVGLNIAKAVWGLRNMELAGLIQAETLNATDLGQAYRSGVEHYERNDDAKSSVLEINKILYKVKQDDTESKWVEKWYELGRKISLDYFKSLYDKLGSSFVWSVGESEVSEDGKKIVQNFIGKGVFEKSEDAIVFRGEKFNPKLHTRVFINKEGLPTYEAKELGLTKRKFEKYNPSQSIVVTANEQNDYFKVVLEALKQIQPDAAAKTKHLSHGILKLPTGKMSSRTGDVITAESLIMTVTGKVKAKMEGTDRVSGPALNMDTAEQVAIGAIKYMILRSNIGGDIVFDIEKSVSTEGDSGVYLQYAHARANSLLEKAGKKGSAKGEQGEVREVERLLYRFPEIIERAQEEYAPHYITTYLTELASSFNNFYAHEQVIGDSEEADYRLAIVEAFRNVMKNGLSVLGIPAPLKM